MTDHTLTGDEAKTLAEIERRLADAETAERAERARAELDARKERETAELEEKAQPIRERFAALIDEDDQLAEAREEVAAAIAHYGQAQRQRGEDLLALYNEAVASGLDWAMVGIFDIGGAQTVARREADTLSNAASELRGERRWESHYLFPPQANPYELPYDKARMYATREHRRQRLLALTAGMPRDVRDRTEKLTRLRKWV